MYELCALASTVGANSVIDAYMGLFFCKSSFDIKIMLSLGRPISPLFLNTEDIGKGGLILQEPMDERR